MEVAAPRVRDRYEDPDSARRNQNGNRLMEPQPSLPKNRSVGHDEDQQGRDSGPMASQVERLRTARPISDWGRRPGLSSVAQCASW